MAASSSRCARTIPISRSPSAPASTKRPSEAERDVVLGDLVPLRKVGIEVVLPVEERPLGDLAVERQAELHGPFDRRRGWGRAASPGVRGRRGRCACSALLAPDVLAAAEHLRPRLELGVDLETDDRLPAVIAAARARSRSRWPLERVANAEECVLRELRADQLQPHGQALGEAARDREAGEPGHVRRNREDVREVHGERVLRLLADAEGDGRRGWADEDVEVLERRGVFLRDHRTDFLRLAVVRVVVAGREGIRAEEDAALHSAPKPSQRVRA